MCGIIEWNLSFVFFFLILLSFIFLLILFISNEFLDSILFLRNFPLYFSSFIFFLIFLLYPHSILTVFLFFFSFFPLLIQLELHEETIKEGLGKKRKKDRKEKEKRRERKKKITWLVEPEGMTVRLSVDSFNYCLLFSSSSPSSLQFISLFPSFFLSIVWFTLEPSRSHPI